ncbi:glutamine--tRNA ligase/YqeY domain fusion protein [Mycoplasmatota bacterium]|nr:glutamine--tRNA ligase/YqeY domain fusion protein [Mycoplasmatota bacterium]
MERSNFIKTIIKNDLENGKHDTIITRYPPEPNGYIHIGHAMGFINQYYLAKDFGGYTNLRFDDTNPVAEDTEYVEGIIEDFKWLGLKWKNLLFASDYFEEMYNRAILLIKKGKAYVCDLSIDEIREYRGDITTPGKNSPYRNRSVEENLDLFERMKNGELKEGEKVLRAKIDMASPNMNLRDPLLYRILYAHHHRTGDKWCIYPMYDYAHSIEDAIEGITHSVCSLEFENHRPLYDWVVAECEMENVPRQIEYGRFNLTNTVMSKRLLRRLVEESKVLGWDDPRMPTIVGLRRRGFTPEAITNFVLDLGLSKKGGVTDYAMFEQYLRQDLKLKAPRPMAVINPLKVVITNYPEGKTEYVSGEWNQEAEEFGSREIPFSREIYIEREDFLEEKPNKKWKRLSIGLEVRLRHAYFIKCEEVIKDNDGNILELRCTYDKETKSGSGFDKRKPNGTIHWVDSSAIPAEFRLYDALILDGDGDFAERINPDSLKIVNGLVESSLSEIKHFDKFQFIRNGFFSVDPDTNLEEGKYVFNRIVPLKSTFKR